VFSHYYNYERPHQSFGDAMPAERDAGEVDKKAIASQIKRVNYTFDNGREFA